MIESEQYDYFAANDPKVIEFLQYIGVSHFAKKVVITIEAYQPILIDELRWAVKFADEYEAAREAILKSMRGEE